MKAPFVNVSHRGYLGFSGKGVVTPKQPRSGGKSIYDPMPIEKLNPSKVKEETVGGAIESMKPNSIPSAGLQKKDFTPLSNVLSAVQLGERTKGRRKKIRL